MIEQARKTIQDFIDQRQYSYSVEEMVENYVTHYKAGYYISNSMDDGIKHLEAELELLSKERDREPIPCNECCGSGFLFGSVCGNCHGGYVGVKMRQTGAGVTSGMGAGMKQAIQAIIKERQRQDKKWGAAKS